MMTIDADLNNGIKRKLKSVVLAGTACISASG